MKEREEYSIISLAKQDCSGMVDGPFSSFSIIVEGEPKKTPFVAYNPRAFIIVVGVEIESVLEAFVENKIIHSVRFETCRVVGLELNLDFRPSSRPNGSSFQKPVRGFTYSISSSERILNNY